MKNYRSYFTCAAAVIFAACSQNPEVILETEKGDIVIEVFEDKAPLSSADFLYYVDEGLYNGQGFYRVVRPETDPRGMGMTLIQGGRLDAERVTPSIKLERTDTTGLSHISGTVGMARDAEPDSGSAAFFFINNGDNSFLDAGGGREETGNGYAVFGQVIEGMDVVATINALPSTAPAPAPALEGQFMTQGETVTIISARRK